MGKKSKSKPTGRSAKSSASAPGVPDQVEQPTASVRRNDCGEFKLGDRITLKDLATSKYNGKHGTIESLSTSASCRYGIRIDGSKAAIAIQPQNIVSANEIPSRKTTQQLREERDRVSSQLTISKEDAASADQLRMVRMMTNMFMTEEQQRKAYGRKIEPIPDFRAELMKEGGGFPTGVNYTWADNYLSMSYETASSLPHTSELVLKGENYEPSTRYYLKRLGTNDREKLEWYFGAAVPGSIFLQRTVHPYTDYVRHSFSNQTYRKEQLYQGTTHVAVGFVDLGILFAAELSGPPSNQCDGPLHFLGIDMSAYAVAKTLVLWELLKQTPSGSPRELQDHLRRIMQVWYSATWGEGTTYAVKVALSVLCSSSSSKNSFCPSVRELLHHWWAAVGKSGGFPLESARKELAAATTNSFSAVGDLMNKRDRIAMAKYELTRDFGVSNAPVCGNTLMFDCPDGTPPLDNDETVFSALNLPGVMDLLRRDKLSKMTILEAAEEYALGGIAKLASWAQSDQVSLELTCARIQDVLVDVAARKPWTMSWSNLPDYVDYAEFHNMARRCSVHGNTVHFGYSMNWISEVFGVNIIDYRGKERSEARASIIEIANKSVEHCYRLKGWQKYFRSPPPTNPINTTSNYGLEFLHYKKWADYFFGIAQRGGPCQVANLEHAIGSPVSSTGCSTVAFTWTSDPEITFNSLLS